MKRIGKTVSCVIEANPEPQNPSAALSSGDEDSRSLMLNRKRRIARGKEAFSCKRGRRFSNLLLPTIAAVNGEKESEMPVDGIADNFSKAFA